MKNLTLEPRLGEAPRSMPAPDAGTNSPTAAVEGLVQRTVQEAVGRSRVERGTVHPYFASLGKALLSEWDAERAVSRRGLKGFVEQAGENARAWTQVWLERAQRYGAGGVPVDSDGLDDARRAPVFPGSPGALPSFQDRERLRRQMREQFRATRRAVIRVVQAADGTVTSVELVSPSNDPEVDREAVEDVRRAATRLPPPPDDAMDGRAQVVSLWQFELIVSISPPVPTLTFEFDEALGFVDPRLPLDRRIYKRVRLLAVE